MKSEIKQNAQDMVQYTGTGMRIWIKDIYPHLFIQSPVFTSITEDRSLLSYITGPDIPGHSHGLPDTHWVVSDHSSYSNRNSVLGRDH
jgi:hypothetical protein